MLTQEKLKEVVKYYPSTGKFTWKKDRTGRGVRKPTFAGDVAGNIGTNGYVIICIDGVQYYAHRLAWLYANGVWPENSIDHKNLIRTDNRIKNLRDVRSGPNQHNRATPPKGISFRKDRNIWEAQIGVNGKNVNLGHYKIEAEAKAARIGAEKILTALGIKLN